MSIRKHAGNLAVAVIILFLCLPLAFMTTVFTSPFWSWFERKFGIESYGHSGPDDWVHTLVYGICVAAGFYVWYRARRAQKERQPRNRDAFALTHQKDKTLNISGAVMVWTGWTVFLLSMLVPSAGVSSTIYGWELLLMTMEALGKTSLSMDRDNVHFALGGVANIIMFITPLGLFTKSPGGARVFTAILSLTCVVALSFVAYHAVALIGYYLWAASFFLACSGFWLLSRGPENHPRGEATKPHA